MTFKNKKLFFQKKLKYFLLFYKIKPPYILNIENIRRLYLVNLELFYLTGFLPRKVNARDTLKPKRTACGPQLFGV